MNRVVEQRSMIGDMLSTFRSVVSNEHLEKWGEGWNSGQAPPYTFNGHRVSTSMTTGTGLGQRWRCPRSPARLA